MKNVNYLFITLIICFCFVNQHGFDSDWNVYILDYYLNTGLLYNTLFEITPSFSRLYYFFHASLLSVIDHPNSFVFQNIIFSLIGFTSFNLTLKNLEVDKSSRLLLLILFITLGISSGILTNSRMEIVYINLIYVQFLILTSNLDNHKYLKLFMIGLIGVISFSSHPNGIISLALFIVHAIFTINRQNLLKILMVCVLLIIILNYTLFYNISPVEFYTSLVSQKNSPGYSMPWFMEYKRYSHLFKESIEVSIIIIFITSLLLINTKIRLKNLILLHKIYHYKIILIITLITIIYLTFFNGSKISFWYISLLFPPVLIILNYLIRDLSENQKKHFLYFFMILNFYLISHKVISNEIFLIKYTPSSISEKFNRVNKLIEITDTYSSNNLSVDPEIYTLFRNSLNFHDLQILQTKNFNHNYSDFVITRYNNYRDQLKSSDYILIETFKLNRLNFVILKPLSNN